MSKDKENIKSGVNPTKKIIKPCMSFVTRTKL